VVPCQTSPLTEKGKKSISADVTDGEWTNRKLSREAIRLGKAGWAVGLGKLGLSVRQRGSGLVEGSHFCVSSVLLTMVVGDGRMAFSVLSAELDLGPTPTPEAEHRTLQPGSIGRESPQHTGTWADYLFVSVSGPFVCPGVRQTASKVALIADSILV
jgi:hypothetical protein